MPYSDSSAPVPSSVGFESLGEIPVERDDVVVENDIAIDSALRLAMLGVGVVGGWCEEIVDDVDLVAVVDLVEVVDVLTVEVDVIELLSVVVEWILVVVVLDLAVDGLVTVAVGWKLG